MGQLQLRAEVHGERLLQARELFFEQGDHPDGLVDPLILRSWERCRRFGVGDPHLTDVTSTMDRVALKTEQERNRFLLMQSRPIMEHVFEQIRESGSMVILADANGLLLETVGDPDFVSRADRVSLMAGASWDENLRGTNAIGTALAEESPVTVLGAEHFLQHNGFLTCCASPIYGPDGRLVGVLDISGSYRSLQRHTLGLVRLSSALVEKRLFEAFHARDILVCFHSRPDYLGSPKEGIAAVTPDGRVLAMNSSGTEILGIRQVDAIRRDFSIVFESNLSALIDRLRHSPQGIQELCVNGKLIHVQLRGQLPTPSVHGGRGGDERALPLRPARRADAGAARLMGNNPRPMMAALQRLGGLSPEPLPANMAASGIAGGKGWQNVAGQLADVPGPLWPPRLAVFSVEVSGPAPVDLSSFALVDAGWQALLANGDLARGSDFWFFTSDHEHLPWHAKNLFVHTYVEQGLLGVAALTLILAAGAVRLFRQALGGQTLAGPTLAALAGLLTVGMVDSVVDMPRVTVFLMFLLWLALTLRQPPGLQHPQ